MFTLLPNTGAPLSWLLSSQGLPIILFITTVVGLAICLVYGKRGWGDGASADNFGDWGDGGGDGSCD